MKNNTIFIICLMITLFNIVNSIMENNWVKCIIYIISLIIGYIIAYFIEKHQNKNTYDIDSIYKKK